jgi:hypothetical protein
MIAQDIQYHKHHGAKNKQQTNKQTTNKQTNNQKTLKAAQERGMI